MAESVRARHNCKPVSCWARGVAQLYGKPCNEDDVLVLFCASRGSSFGRLAALKQLRVLSMVDCTSVTDYTLSCLSAVSSIQELFLDLCDKITDAGALLRVFLLPAVSHFEADLNSSGHFYW
jgi:hypothetical protein